MASNERRRERYRTDESYRERRLRQAQDARDTQIAERERIKRLRGWEPIGTAPDGEMILLYDPKVFWPVVAMMGKTGEWDCVHYQGPPIRPTHWRPTMKTPL